MADLYDVENALREVARARQRQDVLTTATTAIADDLAVSLARHFGSEGVEIAGLALVLCGASVGALKELPIEVVANVIAFAGQRLVLDARAADEAVSHG